MKRNILLTLILVIAIAFMAPVGAYAAKNFDGWMQGFNCVTHGHKCPIDNLDPHLMLESDFVLLLNDGNYFLLPNISRVVKAKYVHSAIRVTGDVNSKYKSIDVDKLEVKEGNSFKTVWSKKMMMEEWEKRQEEFYGEDGG